MNGEELTRRRVEIFNEQRLDEFGDVFAEDLVTHYNGQDVHGIEELKATLQGFAAFSDLETTIEALVSDCDKIGVRYLTRARHTGEFMGIAPSGREVAFGGAGINRIADGRIVESWTVDDFSALVRQISTPSSH